MEASVFLLPHTAVLSHDPATDREGISQAWAPQTETLHPKFFLTDQPPPTGTPAVNQRRHRPVTCGHGAPKRASHQRRRAPHGGRALRRGGEPGGDRRAAGAGQPEPSSRAADRRVSSPQGRPSPDPGASPWSGAPRPSAARTGARPSARPADGAGGGGGRDCRSVAGSARQPGPGTAPAGLPPSTPVTETGARGPPRRRGSGRRARGAAARALSPILTEARLGEIVPAHGQRLLPRPQRRPAGGHRQFGRGPVHDPPHRPQRHLVSSFPLPPKRPRAGADIGGRPRTRLRACALRSPGSLRPFRGSRPRPRDWLGQGGAEPRCAGSWPACWEALGGEAREGRQGRAKRPRGRRDASAGRAGEERLTGTGKGQLLPVL